ncbi:hydrogenase maturation protease [Clostridium botulinum]|uniref:hydrogenase maturation protease n=1 Tax=Clostridium botulinum TaxID=1491 RepID=UPI000174EB00|nr:hydrogenase maturation protease [Clostridium botulinum]ACD53173.1 hydrogenase maturation protease superfamily [Clostridium botulinum E3 str. Alaska E43]AJF29576.1 hydrogenase maturation protease [Clostridium botulinum]AJF32637.1 hydrogenase maturation protease [Clostridium botulinum]MBY6789277.1 hydrogenase maturation protease [Clostridium botulinum]MBY6816959.1 hydrogenase maturation protease [Clostridium botulinum]
MIRIFGVGNVLLCDDGIGVKVCQCIKEKFKSYKSIKFIIGETDLLYCLDYIEDMTSNDIAVIIDSTCFENIPGKVTLKSFKECDEFINMSFESHSETLLKVLRRDYRYINGYLIGIEISKIDYSLDLSVELTNKFDDICNCVSKTIENIVNNKSHVN